MVSSISIFSTNEYLQISAVKVIDENGQDISTTGRATAKNPSTDGRILPGNANNGINKLKPWYEGYQSHTDGNDVWTLTFPKPVNVKQVVYYNGQIGERHRARSYRLAAHDENGNILYQSAQFTVADVQTFDVNIKIKSIDNEIDSLSKLWNDSTAQDMPITSNSNIPGYGLQNLNILVSKDGYKETESNFLKTQNVGSNVNGTLYKTITAITEEQCKASCVDNLDCKSYSITNPRNVVSEGPPTSMGYFLDDERPGRPRAMEQWYAYQSLTNLNDFTVEECLAKTIEKNPDNKYFALQAKGHCFSSNKSPQDGYAKYGATSPCGEKGGWWCNHVFQRNQKPENLVDCNLYRENQNPVSIPGATLGNRGRVSEPVNPTKLNLTNNIYIPYYGFSTVI
jgi:hypothetical protein